MKMVERTERQPTVEAALAAIPPGRKCVSVVQEGSRYRKGYVAYYETFIEIPDPELEEDDDGA